MSDSESYGSANDGEIEKLEETEDESDDDKPLLKGKISPKKSKTAAKSPKKILKKDKILNKKNLKTPPKPKEDKPTKSSDKKKPKQSSKTIELVPADPLEDKSDEEYEVEAIVGHREYNGRLAYKIRWKNYDPIHDTWEEYSSLSCPDLLERYNTKHNIEVRSSHKQPKRKVVNRGKPKKQKKKRKNSVSEDDAENESDQVPYDEGSDAEYEVERIIDMKTKTDGTREFLVHWKRWSSDHDTWEPEENLNCKDLIEKYLQRLEEAKSSTVKELRTIRKHTDRFTLNTQENGRRLSRRNRQKQRVAYFDADGDDED